MLEEHEKNSWSIATKFEVGTLWFVATFKQKQNKHYVEELTT